MHYRQSKPKKLRKRWLVLMLMGLTGCSTSSHQFFCLPEQAYTETGAKDVTTYRVDRECYKSMTKKQKACYAEANE